MRAARFASLFALALAVITACDDDTVVTPVANPWLEWSDSVLAGTPFGVRVRGVDAYGSELRVVIRVAHDTVTVLPYAVAGPPQPGVLRVIPWYDTLVWVPAITATANKTVTIRGPSGLHAGAPPWPLRTFGTLTVSVDTPVAPHVRSVGLARGFKNASDCFMVAPAAPGAPNLPFHLYVSADQAPRWAPEFMGFVFGRIDPVLRSTCLDDAYVIEVDSIIP